MRSCAHPFFTRHDLSAEHCEYQYHTLPYSFVSPALTRNRADLKTKRTHTHSRGRGWYLLGCGRAGALKSGDSNRLLLLLGHQSAPEVAQQLLTFRLVRHLCACAFESSCERGSW